MSVILPSSASLDTRFGTERQKLTKTAKQFEAVFVRQMLAAARKAEFGGEDSLFGGEAMDTFRQLQDEHFADITAQTGTLGLASVIEAQMARFLKPEGEAPASFDKLRMGGSGELKLETAQPEPVEGPAAQPDGSA